MKNSHRQSRTGLVLVLLASALYGYLYYDRGWIPHDEGTIAQAAERFIGGELPHRDYNDPYTGGLTALHAAAFRVLGTNLVSLRIVLFLFMLAFAATLYGIALRLVSPAMAVLVTLCGLAWSVPNYFASLPSWYNLFFATFGAFALIRHVETGLIRWLFLTGLFAGVSLLFKIIGLYFVAAVLLFLVYRESELWAACQPEKSRRSTTFLVVKATACAALVAVVAQLVRQQLTLMGAFHFVLPVVALVWVLLACEWKYGGGRFGERVAGLQRLLGPFLLGIVLVVGLFIVPYLMSGSLEDLFRGVFLDPQKRLGSAAFDLPPLQALLPAIPYFLLLLLPWAVRPGIPRRMELSVSLLLAGVLALTYQPGVYRAIWFSARSLAPIATLAGCLSLASGRLAPASGPKRQFVFLLVALTALVSLVQFPYAAPIYFCYVAPLVVLAITAIVASNPGAPRLLHVGVLTFYLFFAALFLNTGYVSSLGDQYVRYVADGRLDLERGGLRIPENDAGKYEYLVAAIEQHSGGGEIYAGPDCPEVYFLSGRRNPTRSFFEFLGEYSARAESLLPLLEARRTRYPKMSIIGEFVMMWRD